MTDYIARKLKNALKARNEYEAIATIARLDRTAPLRITIDGTERTPLEHAIANCDNEAFIMLLSMRDRPMTEDEERRLLSLTYKKNAFVRAMLTLWKRSVRK